MLIAKPSVIEAAGNKPKIIREHVGRVNSKTENISIAHMTSPAGWEEPGQTPEFDEYTLVLKGCVRVTTKKEVLDVKEGQTFLAKKGEWVKYSTPEGADYIATCIPAFSPDTVHRDS
ncbi:cupin [bacterium]|nr:cupin [bacterium]